MYGRPAARVIPDANDHVYGSIRSFPNASHHGSMTLFSSMANEQNCSKQIDPATTTRVVTNAVTINRDHVTTREDW